MALTDYCALAEIRAALGVNDVELKDAVLNLPVYEMGLVRELNKVSTSLPAAFSTISATQSNQRSPAEKALYDATHLFAVYAVAKQVGVSLASFVPKDITDSKAGLSRFAGEPYKDTMDRIEAMCTALRSSLASAMTDYAGGQVPTASTIPPTMVRAGARQIDPVTGS